MSAAALTLEPLLTLRGGFSPLSIPDTVSTIAAKIAASERRDHAALVVSLAVMLSFETTVKALVAGGYVSTVAGRKMLHIMCGPIFISLWPLFSAGDSNAKWLAALCPAFMTLKFAAVGAGLLNLPKVVASMSRSGDRRELLRGPTCYGVVFTVSTLLFWRDLIGVMALITLCMGDASAEIIGTRFGGTLRIPWNKRKSVAGTMAFFVSSVAAGAALVMSLGVHGWWPAQEPLQLLARLSVIAMSAALAESLDWGEWDNLAVAAAAMSAGRLTERVLPGL
mmetsp:Transcript_36858/g.85129  ORF Transcript_36858/g.85129 Transcript_36858/m.85129 type:complete len:280 (-) Transcript_36858:188-1027(-)